MTHNEDVIFFAALKRRGAISLGFVAGSFVMEYHLTACGDTFRPAPGQFSMLGAGFSEISVFCRSCSEPRDSVDSLPKA